MNNFDFDKNTVEKLLLKQLLYDKKYANILSSSFDKRWFDDKNIEVLIHNIIFYYQKYNALPNKNLLKFLNKKYIEGNPSPVSTLSELNSTLDEVMGLDLNLPQEVINNNLKEFIRRESLYTAIIDNINDINDRSDTVIDKCLDRFDKVNKLTFSDTDLGMDYFSNDDMESHWKFINEPESKIPTGWNTLDGYTNGGFFKNGKMLALFMGQAGLGKSLFLSNLAVNFLKQNKSVVVISLEMSQDVYAQRFDAHISNVDINRLKDNSSNAQSRIREFFKQHPQSRLYIKEYPPRTICCKDISLYLENLKNDGKHFDVVIVDYLNIVRPNVKTDSMFKDGLAVSEELRELSYKFCVPVISAVQANTEGMMNENIDMQNISESRGIAHTADFIGGLYQTPDDRRDGVIKMRISKNRLGGNVGKVLSFKMNAETLIVKDISFNIDEEDNELNNLTTNMSNICKDIDNEEIFTM